VPLLGHRTSDKRVYTNEMRERELWHERWHNQCHDQCSQRISRRGAYQPYFGLLLTLPFVPAGFCLRE
jgi:hypothetical protein